ncbi:hypothetical protein [Helicobacter sp. UBA3407]|uniref:hypothetical protein n=1 Tax=Helicobacter TaxID=209 RepID=UPI00260A4380|nr:hypothetical protein [Helicobacter sp. UBA3407]
MHQSQANFEQLFVLIDSMTNEMQLALFDYNERDSSHYDWAIKLMNKYLKQRDLFEVN